MARDLKMDRTYRLVYFQPSPEDGERVCVALLFRDRRDYALAYDRSFQKLNCIAPKYERGLLKFYLDELEDSLTKATDDHAEFILARYGPQILVSGERELLAPLTDAVKQRLLERFILGRSSQTALAIHGPEENAPTVQQATDESIETFVKEMIPSNTARVTFRARSKQIIGRSLPNVAPVAASVRVPGKLILIDGVDLKVASAKQVINRVNKVTHTFWEYGKAERERVLSGTDSLHRIALVLNGIDRYSSAQRDAQDFALHQFEREAELLVTDRSKDDRVKRLITS